MKILLVWDYYPAYLRAFYAQHPEARDRPYAQQLALLLDDFFTWPAYLVPELNALGHETAILIGNARWLQLQWAKENGLIVDDSWQLSILREQIKRFHPDVLWLCGVDYYLSSLLRQIRHFCRRVISWRATEWPGHLDWSNVDCVLSSHTHFIEQFRRLGVSSELMLPCFPPQILTRLAPGERACDVAFIGSLDPIHFSQRIKTLRYIQKRTSLRIYAEKPIYRRRPLPLDLLARQLSVLPELVGLQRNLPVYGLEMFQVLSQAKIVLNVHTNSANGLAGNIRMFETTGVGALLVTEAAPNLSELFQPDRQVIAYASPEEALEKIQYYLEHESERKVIADSAQMRTLAEYSSAVRAAQFLDIVSRQLRA